MDNQATIAGRTDLLTYQMSQVDHLNLQRVQLKRGGRWAHAAPGLFFALAQDGEGLFLATGKPLPVSRGDVVVGNSHAKATIGASTAGFAFWVFSVCVEQLLPLFAAGEISSVHSLNARLKHGRVIPASSTLAAECHQLCAEISGRDGLDHRAQLLRIAAVVLNDELRCVQLAQPGLTAVEQHLVRSFAKLSTDEFLSLSVSELAGRFGCSRRHLNRLFRQHFNNSVAALKMEMRLLKAVSLLRDPQAKVINVAAECGFNHLGLFNTCFRKRFGTSPSQWRRSALAGPATLLQANTPANLGAFAKGIGGSPAA